MNVFYKETKLKIAHALPLFNFDALGSFKSLFEFEGLALNDSSMKFCRL